MGGWRDQRTYPEEWVGKKSDSLGKSIRMGGPKKGGRPFWALKGGRRTGNKVGLMTWVGAQVACI